MRKVTMTGREAPGASAISGKFTAAASAGTLKPGSMGVTRKTMRVL